MAIPSFIQPSFSGGEYSPSLYSRVDIQKYASGLRTCRNFIIHPHGGASNRPGTKYVADTKYSNRKCRLEKFIFSQDQTYILEVGHEYIRFYTEQAQIIDEDSLHYEYNDMDTFTVLCLHCDGVDDSTDFEDASTYNHTVSAYGTAVMDTAQQKFGVSSARIISASGYLTVPDSDNFYFGTGSFTIDFWARWNGTPANSQFCGQTEGAGSNKKWTIFYDVATSRLRFYYQSPVGSDRFVTFDSFNPTGNAWHHIAICRDKNTWYGYYDGVQTDSSQSSSYEVLNTSSLLYIGADGAGSTGFNGWIDEFRISKGVARWTSNFTVPAAAYTDYDILYDPYEVETVYQEEDLFDLRFESSADTIYITHPDYQPMILSRYDIDNWVLSYYAPDNGPFMIENTDDTINLTASAVSGSITINASDALFSDLHVDSLWKLRHYVEGQTVSTSFASATTSTSIKCFTTWRVISHGTWTGKFRIEKSSDGGSTWTVLRSFTSQDDFNANTSGTEDIELNTEPFLVRVNMYDYTSGTANVDLTTDAFYQEGIARVDEVVSSITVNATTVQDIADTTATTEWAEGSWSDYRGWPSVARFYQDRLCFAGSYSEPMTIWMSELGAYDSFIRHSSLLDTDAITTNLPSRQVNAINGMVALRDLVVFTSSSEWTISPVSGSGLTPTSIQQNVQGYRGSYGIDPEIVGNECIYVQANSKVIRNLAYNFTYDSYVGADLNLLSKHLFDYYTIIQIAYQQDPDSVIWCLRDDGKLLGLTYLPEQEVVAWHWHDTDGEIESIATIPGDGFDELWMSVKRQNGRYIEYMTQRNIYVDCNGERQLNLSDQVFLDSSISFSTRIYVENIEVDDYGITIDLGGDYYTTGDDIVVDCVDGPDINGVEWKVYKEDDGTWLLLHLNDDFTDSSHNNYAVTATASTGQGHIPVIDNDSYILGDGSAYFDPHYVTYVSSSDYYTISQLTVEDNDDIQMTGDFTYECRFKTNSPRPVGGVNEFSFHFFRKLSSAYNYYRLRFNCEAKTYINYGSGIYFSFDYYASGGHRHIYFDWGEYELGRWYAICFVKSGNTVRLFVDGEQIGGDQTLSYDVPSAPSADFVIGHDYTTGCPIVYPTDLYTWWLDEIRVSSVARYSSNYIVPNKEFIDSSNSILLADPDTILPISGNGYDKYVSGGYVEGGSTSYSGLDHLEGQTVGILADGEVLDDQVVEDGSISITVPYSTVQVGLKYLSDLETLNIEVASNAGTLQGRRTKVANVTFRVVNTRGGWVGPDEDTLYDAFDDVIDERLGSTDFTQMFTGDIRMPIGAGYEDGGRVFYRQVDPLPVTVTAVIEEFDAGGYSR